MEGVVLRKHSPDYDDASECSEDGRLLGAPQLLCLLTCGALLSLIGVFITSYGYFVDSSHQLVLKAIGPALLVLGLMVLLICVCACVCACHRNHQLPPMNESEYKPRATFYYDHDNINEVLQNHGGHRASGMPQGYGHSSGQPLEYPNMAAVHAPNQGRGHLQGSGHGAGPGYEYNGNVMAHKEMASSSHRSNQELANYRKISSSVNVADKSGNYGKKYSNEESQQQDAIRFLASTVAMEQNRRKYSGQISVESNISGNGHQPTYRTPSNSTISSYPQNVYPSDHMTGYPNTQASSGDVPQASFPNIPHSHSVHCLGVPGVRNHPGNLLPNRSPPQPDASLSDDSGVGGLKRTNRMYALNVGFIEDVEDEESYVQASGGRTGRDRTFSISGDAPHRLRRNYTVSSAMHKAKNIHRGQAPYNQSGSALYQQQLSIPSGSFQHLATMDYETQHGKKNTKEFVEKQFGSGKLRKKSTKGKKKNADDDTPVVCPLPSCSDETLKAIGLDIPPHDHHPHPGPHMQPPSQASSTNLSPFNDDGSHSREHLENLNYEEDAAGIPFDSRDRPNPVHLSFSNNNIEYVGYDEEADDTGLRSDGARPSGYSAKSRLSLIPEVQGHGTSTEQDNFVSGTAELSDGESGEKDIKDRIEEIKGKIEEITREKETLSSGQRRRPSMGVQALHKT